MIGCLMILAKRSQRMRIQLRKRALARTRKSKEQGISDDVAVANEVLGKNVRQVQVNSNRRHMQTLLAYNLSHQLKIRLAK